MDTRDKKCFTRKAWANVIVKVILDMSLGIWDDRCKILHDRTEGRQRKIEMNKVILKVQRCFNHQ